MMPYVKVDDDIFRNPKVVRVGTVAKLIYIASICYSGNQLTDGFIPRSAVRSLSADAGVNYSPKVARELTEAGLWLETDDGFQVHDYLQHNESAEKVRAKKEAARQRMERLRSGEVRANTPRTSGEVRDTTTTTDVSPNGEKSNTSESPPQKSPKRITYPDDFEAFWKRYPSGHGDKKPAYEVWKRLAPDDALRAEIMAGLEGWHASERWQRGYIKQAQKWLSDLSWESVPPPPAPPGPVSILPGGRLDPNPRNPKRGYSQDELQALSHHLREQERLRETS